VRVDTRSHSTLLAVAATLGLGVAVGFSARAGHYLDGDAYWAASLGGPWLVAAFLAGAVAERWGWGALAGATAIVVGTLTYYWSVAVYHGLTLTLDGPLVLDRARYGVVMTIGWCAAGVAVGAAFGLAGVAWRRGGSSLTAIAGVAALAGALIGEALLLRSLWTDPWAQRVLELELVAGLAAAVVLTRRRAATLTLAIVAAGGFALAEQFVRETLRAAGWAGA
jgi:Family of unknown function (DUF6518)